MIAVFSARVVALAFLPAQFSWEVSGMMMPPADFASASIRSTTTRSCSGRNFIGALLRFLQKVWQIWTADRYCLKLFVVGPILRDLLQSDGPIYYLGHACLDCAGSLSRYLLSEHGELLVLLGHDLELLAHLRGC